MQLPPDDAVVMVSGHPPIRARKIRYYLDRNFTVRVNPAPLLASSGRYADAPAPRADDWGGLAPLATPILDMALAGQAGTVDGGGHQHQTELGEGVYAPQPVPGADDLGLLDDDDSPVPMPTQLDPRLQRAARLAALDPDDGIAL
jgi:type IV secretion system protein VirD4